MSRRAVVHARVLGLLTGTAALAGVRLDGPRPRGRTWVPWDELCAALDELAARCGGDDALAALALGPLEPAVEVIAAAFPSAAQLYQYIFHVIGPAVFPTLELAFEERGDRELSIAYSICDGVRGGRALGYATLAVIRGLAVQLGGPVPRVDADIGERHAAYDVHFEALPPQREPSMAALEAMLSLIGELTRDRLALEVAEEPPRDRLSTGLQRLRETHHLSPRQLEVVSEVLRGRSNKEIASALGCTDKAVELHVTAVLRKLTVQSRAQLIARFWSGV